jgi:hypothetical protein
VRRSGNTSGRAALVISVAALVLSMSGLANAARHDVVNLIDGHAITAKPKANAIPVLGKDGRLPAAMLPTSVDAAKLGGETRSQLTGSCPTQTVDLGTWCLMSQPYPLTAAEQQAGVNDYAWASQACVALGGFLPSASELVGAADKVRLESTIDDNPATSIVDVDNDGGVTSVAIDQREMSSTLVTTAAGSDAAGSEGVSPGSTASTPGEPNPVPQPAVPFPPTLQYVTVYDNHQQGGFAGSEPVSNPENFRCGFYLKQSASK